MDMSLPAYIGPSEGVDIPIRVLCNDLQTYNNVHEFHRERVWSLRQEQRLIKSLFLGKISLEIRVIRKGNRFIVLDGHQQLTALVRFYHDAFATAKTKDDPRQSLLVEPNKRRSQFQEQDKAFFDNLTVRLRYKPEDESMEEWETADLFGKSNFNKLLLSELYTQNPTVAKRRNRKVPVGTLVFDPDGEYFWPDDKGRPGLCDVPALQEKLVVFTQRHGPSPFYSSFVAGGVRLDIRRVPASVVLSVALSAHKQGQQNVQKLKSLEEDQWRALVDLIDEKGNRASIKEIGVIFGLDKRQETEALAARSNMTAIVQILHDKNSHLVEMLMEALSEGKLCVMDISQLHGSESLILSGLILRIIFDHNQAQYTEEKPTSIPTIAVIEEAQSVLAEKSPAAHSYRDWVKEGRKYDLGSLLITQQPGSIPNEILSQSDNWFALHLLSTTDLRTLQKANAYFSQDILRMLLNEPIPGHCAFWTSVGGKPYPVSTRILSFEQKYSMRDSNYDMQKVDTFAHTLKMHCLRTTQRLQRWYNNHVCNEALTCWHA